MTRPPRPQVRLTLEYVGPPEWYTHKLRAVLKAMGRTFGFRCVGISELTPAEVKVNRALDGN